MDRREAKRIVITGASSGIGAATAEAFAAAGARLVLAARNAEALEAVADRCRAAGGEAIVVPTDVTKPAAVTHLAARAQAFLGEIDLWFSNVGIGAVGRFQDVPIEAHRRVIEANLIGHLNDAHAVLPIFIAQRRGIFVNMISVGAFVPAPLAVAYSASKFGLRGMSEALRGELAEHPHIHICDVYPTLVDTPAFRHSGNYLGSAVDVSGAMDPRHVARAVLDLADHPRNSVGVGAPVGLMKLAQMIGPNLGAAATRRAILNGLDRSQPMHARAGNLFVPPAESGQVDGGFRNPARRDVTTAAIGIAGIAAIAIGSLWLARRSSDAAAPLPPPPA